jgi:phosphate transport system protein
MTTHLQMEIDHIKEKVFEMADRSSESLDKAIAALKELDAAAAQKVIDKDNVIDELEKEIDDECVRLLVTRQPAASDLRFVLAMLKINTDLERIGDLAVNISRETQALCGKPMIKPLIDIPRMAAISIEMLRATLGAIITLDSAAAKAVILRDKEIDDLNKQLFRELFTIMMENPALLSQAFSLIIIARLLERAGDHVTNIAERVVYLVEGVDIRHCSKDGTDENEDTCR